jgi:signal transduction histidine kinase
MFASIIGFLGLAKRKAESGEDADLVRYLNEALESSHRARNLVEQIASFSSKNVTVMKEHKLDAVVLNSLDLLHNVLPSAIEILVDVPDELPLVCVDEEQMKQVLANLLTNASDAMDGNGRIAITAHHEAVTENSCHSCHETYSGDYVMLQVSDSGHGADESIQQRMFEPFFTTREVGKGTGMGLPVVHGIVHTHRGHVQVESEPGAGMTVSLYLPVITA